MKLSDNERCVLELLAGGERTGLGLVHGSGWRLARGTAYVLLAQMEDALLVESKADPSKPGGRIYAITTIGRRALERGEK